MKKSLLLLFATFATLAASAQNKVEINGIWYILKGKQAEVKSKDYGKYSGSITIPAMVTYGDKEYSVIRIGESAFSLCSSLTSVIIPEGVTSIGCDAFMECSFLTDITIPESVTSIERDAFRGCWSLTSITLPESVADIWNWAFADCRGLTTITIPEGVTSIGGWTFQSCSSLTTITIPEGVTSIGYEAFNYCSSLLNVYCYAENIPSTKSDAFNNSNISNATLYVPASALDAYKATAPWSSFGNIVAFTDKEMSIEQLTDSNIQITNHDLQGRRITDTEGLKGIYIVNGKKTIIK